ncbi:MAG TPA: adenylate/guanylate cyclase domain-containing protein [Acidimicrobiia bacterium]|jgi:hypothetical protein
MTLRATPGTGYLAVVLDGPVGRARAALARGDVLIAYDEAVTATEADPHDLDARFVAALALARAGAVERARLAAHELSTSIEARDDIPISLREDAAALEARLAKDEALATSGTDRPARLRRAAHLYEVVADRFGRFYTCINAATLSLLAGDGRRARALAQRAQLLVTESRATEPTGDYWREATAAEAALILGDIDEAKRAVALASELAGDDDAAMAVTRRQLRLVCAATGANRSLLDPLAPPVVLHYCGHRIDAAAGGRFPPDLEARVRGEIAEFLAQRRIGSAHGSLASGADILVAEAILDRGVRLEVVLPFDTDEFEAVSVAPSGPVWTERFRSCLARAASVVHASDSAFMGDDELFGYAARIAMGHALNHAAFLDAPAEQLAVWDRATGTGFAGTAHDVTVWKASGHATHVIELPNSSPADEPPTAEPSATREIGSILFTDLRGFSRLRDEQFPIYVNQIHNSLAVVLDRAGDAVLWRNAWGDAIAAVFADVVAAADCALGFHDTLAQIDLEAIGLPSDLHLRIGAHAGPVIAIVDPVSRRLTYWGRELTRAARIEPRTPEGEVYVTDAFAALLALEADPPFTTEYVGRVTTAKDFETIPMYRLRRRH